MGDGGSDVGSSSDPSSVVGLVGLESQLLELADAAVMVVDLTGRILYANRYAERLYGWTREEMVGRLAAEMSQVALDPAAESEIAAALAVGASWQGTFEV
ncbi:MAG TPA: PAS domain-containing protein, partial [Acidimicrobiales bacterium]|nr:PAS domain-containing protein [Acidimicrobiales bacterium]